MERLGPAVCLARLKCRPRWTTLSSLRDAFDSLLLHFTCAFARLPEEPQNE
jgi:hypothetical protein